MGACLVGTQYVPVCVLLLGTAVQRLFRLFPEGVPGRGPAGLV